MSSELLTLIQQPLLTQYIDKKKPHLCSRRGFETLFFWLCDGCPLQNGSKFVAVHNDPPLVTVLAQAAPVQVSQLGRYQGAYSSLNGAQA
jgi:hypothetical protein